MSSNIKSGAFKKSFSPYLKKYIYKGRGELFGEPFWSTANDRLTDDMIEKAICEKVVLGYFTNLVPNVLGVDIDDHRGKAAWTGTEASPYLLSIYIQTVQRLQTDPSILLQSPRGLHGYWFLTERIPADILQEVAGERLKGIPVEIRPTPSIALRIPSERRILDPKTFQLVSIPFETWVQGATVYHPAILFDDSYLPKTVRESLKSKKSKLKLLRNIPRIEQVEAELLPLQNGDTNEKFLKLCLAYRVAGLEQDGIFYRFTLCLVRSPGYTGDLRNPKRLLQRIESEYRKNTRSYTPKPRAVQGSLFNQALAEDLAKIHPFAKQRTKPIQRFIEKILTWCDWHDEIIQDNRQTAMYDFLYPYYRRNRKQGLYPLPRNFLRKANKRSYEIMPWLKDIGFIEDSGYNYSNVLGVCKYYRLNREVGPHI